LIRICWVPNIDRIYFDEDRYLSHAVSFAKFNKNFGIILATPEKLIIGESDPAARLTAPVINGWVLKLFGYSKGNLYLASKIFSSIEILLVFATLYFLFKNSLAASVASLIFALVPISIYWSVSTAPDSYFIFFSLLTFIASGWYARSRNLISALFMIFSTTILLFTRLEALLFLVVIGATIYSIRKSEKTAIFTKKDLFCSLAVLFIVGIRVYISLPLLGKTWCCAEDTPTEIFSLAYFSRNFLPNLFTFFNRPEFPFAISILAFGTILLVKRKTAKIFSLGLWILLYFFIYSLYFAGVFYTYQFSGSYGRYFLMLVPPLVILASSTICEAIVNFRNFNWKVKLLFFFLSLGLLLTLFPTIRNYRKLIDKSAYDELVEINPRRIQEFLQYYILPQAPPDSIIIHPLVDLVVLYGRAGADYNSFLKNEKIIKYIAEKIKEGKPVFMEEFFTCRDFPERCEKIRPYFDLKYYGLEGDPPGFYLLKLELKEAAP